MKISYNWLKAYVDFDLPYEEVSVIFTNTGLEVEGIEKYESVKGALEGLVIGEVLTKSKHPQADRLSLTTVNTGEETPLSIVCGAPNVEAGQRVVVATVGTTMYKGSEEFTLKRSKIRGELSEGMICAEDEIGLGDSHDGIIVLEDNPPIGMPAKDYFNISTDIVFEIGLTPNRIDGASHIGAARDLAAYLGQTKPVSLKKPDLSHFSVDSNDNPIDIKIENKQACQRYSGISLSDVKVGESPEWLKNRLKAIGMKPINNVVDITNFVLHETGQPLHAFDMREIKGNKIVVRTMPEGTSFKTLDEEERKLSADDLMICNAEEGMCIAGVLGGIGSGVKEGTTEVFLESACFDPVYIRKTSKRHTINTDASFRFERGTDPNGTLFALKRAAMLIKEIAGAKISSEIVDVYPEQKPERELRFQFTTLNTLVGQVIEPAKVKNILQALDIKIVSEDNDGLNLQIPLYRVDVTREADVVEEVLRIYGYNNVFVPEKVNSTLAYAPEPDNKRLTNLVSDFLSSNGFNEMMSNSLTRSSYYEETGTYKKNDCVLLFNPLSADLDSMRQTLLFGGLEAINYNRNRQNPDVKLYEFGTCYYKNSEQKKHSDSLKASPPGEYFEQDKLALFISGNKQKISWNTGDKKSDFFHLKGFVDAVLQRLGFLKSEMKIQDFENDILSYGLRYELKNKELVSYGAVSKALLTKFDIEGDVFYAEFSWNLILRNQNNVITFSPLPKFPEVSRDLALLVDKNTRFSQIVDIAYKTEKKVLRDVSIFDVYQGEELGNNKKSYAVNFILRDDKKTLEDKQIDKIMSKLINNFEKELGAKLR
jgi:phenylalanyl-tRNA synthetase beta chain